MIEKMRRDYLMLRGKNRIKASNKSEYKEEKIKITGYIQSIYKVGWDTIFPRHTPDSHREIPCNATKKSKKEQAGYEYEDKDR